MSTTLRDAIRSQVDWSRARTLDILEGFPPDKATFRTGEHEVHATWVLGHIAQTEAWVLGMLQPGGEQKQIYPEAWFTEQLFEYQRPVKDDASYPPLADVRDVYDRMHALLIAWLDRADDETLLAPLDDRGAGFAKTPAEAIGRMAWHEGWHAGQLSLLRRALGLAPAF